MTDREFWLVCTVVAVGALIGLVLYYTAPPPVSSYPAPTPGRDIRL